MAVAMGFASCKAVLKIPLPDVQLKKSRHLGQAKTPKVQYGARMKEASSNNPWTLYATLPPTDSTSDTSSYSPAQTVTLFYAAINDRNLKQLDKFIAEDCVFEDYTFTKPFQGKEDVLHFFGKLVSGMGKNMRFSVDNVCEGNDYTAVVNWHIDWKKIQIPFTRGCSSYTFSINHNEIVIKRAQVLVEPPIKLGVLALTTLKIVSTIFDAVPPATQWLLKKSHTMVRLLLLATGIALGIVVRPLISPLLAWYLTLLNTVRSNIKFILNFIYYVRKIARI